MKNNLKTYTAPKLEDWGKVVDVTLLRDGDRRRGSGFGGGRPGRPGRPGRD